MKFFLSFFSFLIVAFSPLFGAISQEFIAKQNAHAALLFSKLVTEDENVCISSYSVTNALTLAYVGATGTTQQEIGALFFPESFDEKQAMDETLLLSQYLAPVVHSASLVAIDPKAFVTNEYLERVSSLKAKTHTVSLKESIAEINDWIYEKTAGRISDLLTSQDISASTRLLLINALSLHANWQKPFNTYETHKAPFYASLDEVVEVAMMHIKEHMPVFENDKVVVCFKPLKAVSQDAPHLQAVIVLPKEKNYVPDASEIRAWQQQAQRRYVELFVPKHTVQSRFDLTETLKALGLKESTTARATFSIIDPANTLCIEKVLHQTFMQFDEAGIEASAATSVSIGLTSVIVDEPLVVRCDRPFFVFLQDKVSGVILFSSFLVKPKK